MQNQVRMKIAAFNGKNLGHKKVHDKSVVKHLTKVIIILPLQQKALNTTSMTKCVTLKWCVSSRSYLGTVWLSCWRWWIRAAKPWKRYFKNSTKLSEFPAVIVCVFNYFYLQHFYVENCMFKLLLFSSALTENAPTKKLPANNWDETPTRSSMSVSTGVWV